MQRNRIPRWRLAALAAALMASLAAFDAREALADNDVGCGVGTMVWEGQTGLLPKLAASCTNGLTFQSISITFGVLNCNGRNTVTADAALRRFAAANLDRLARDAARGEGETIEAFAALLGVPAEERPLFAGWTQQHFEALFPHEQTRSGEMLEALGALLQSGAAPVPAAG